MSEPQNCCWQECERVLIDSWLAGVAPNVKIMSASYPTNTGFIEKKIWNKQEALMYYRAKKVLYHSVFDLYLLTYMCVDNVFRLSSY